ncbi:hypothetical protein BCR42DRAFT_425541 [Absidia repens]|uniref:HMG box domain-containing protein n=1 Tax=Absidia repens TaxID=90262 RepID=A0A1X2I262_9FUNG|nr:hypothetical protein BCR42DRAFT_425541 [Absidia repens]
MTDGFMLFCADQTSPSMSAVTTPTLYERWNALSNENKMPYHRQAIIVNARLEETNEFQHKQQETTIDSTAGQLYGSYLNAQVPRQLVSPEAIRSAELEEKEEALGQHPFSAYPSFLSMKHSHEQQRFLHDSIKTPLPMLSIPIDHQSPSSMTQSSTPSPPPPTCSSSLHSNSTFTTTATTTSMISSNLLPPPIPQQQYHPQSYLERQHQQNSSEHMEQRTISEDRSPGRHETTCEPTKNTQISMVPQLGIGGEALLEGISNKSSIPPFITPNKSKKRRSGSTSSSITLERLKRPPNAYLLFNRDMRRKLLALDPKLTVSEISKEIGDRWKYLSPNERQHYIDAAQELKQHHLKNHPDFIYTRRSKAELAEAKRLSKAGKKSTVLEKTVSLATQSPSSYQHDRPQSPSAASHFKISKFPLQTSTTNDDNPPYENNNHQQIFLSSSSSHQNTGNTAISTIDETETTTRHTVPLPTTSSPLLKKHGRRRSQVGQQQRDPRGRKKKRHKHPTAPKHPMSGFLFFLGAVRPEVAQQFPGSTVGPISKEISSRWKNMSPNDREPWLLKAEADKARYAQEMQVYMANLKQEEEQQQQQQQQQNQSAFLSIQEKGTRSVSVDHGDTSNLDIADNIRNDPEDNMDMDNDQMIPTTVVQQKMANQGNTPLSTTTTTTTNISFSESPFSSSSTAGTASLFPFSYSNAHTFSSPSSIHPFK